VISLANWEHIHVGFTAYGVELCNRRAHVWEKLGYNAERKISSAQCSTCKVIGEVFGDAAAAFDWANANKPVAEEGEDETKAA
jgi:hypothetical protein